MLLPQESQVHCRIGVSGSVFSRCSSRESLHFLCSLVSTSAVVESCVLFIELDLWLDFVHTSDCVPVIEGFLSVMFRLAEARASF